MNIDFLETRDLSDSQDESVPAGEQWHWCPVCGELNKLGPNFWWAVEVSGCDEVPTRCIFCGHVYTLRIEGNLSHAPQVEKLPAELLQKLSEILVNTDLEIADALQTLQLEPGCEEDEIEDQLLDTWDGVGRCSVCGHWQYRLNLHDTGAGLECIKCQSIQF